jgi:hypothetical protein
MNDWNEPTDNTIDRISEHLREPVKLDETFDVRVMSAVHAAALAGCDASHEQHAHAAAPRHWWNKRYTLSISPVGALALAASLIAVIYLGTLARTPDETAVATQTAPAKAQNVHFILVDDSAEQVFLVGDFNGWSKTATPLARTANGSAWTVSVPLPSGRHEYAFVAKDARGERWSADPLTTPVEDEFGTLSSVVSVDAAEISSL